MIKHVITIAGMLAGIATGVVANDPEAETGALKRRSAWITAVWDGSRTTGNWVATTSVTPGTRARIRREGESATIEAAFYYDDLYDVDGLAFISQGVANELGVEARTPTRVHVSIVDPGQGVFWGPEDAVEYQDVERILPDELWAEGGSPVVSAVRDEEGNLVNRIRLGSFTSERIYRIGSKDPDPAERRFEYDVTIGTFGSEQQANLAMRRMHREGVRSARVEQQAGLFIVEAGPFVLRGEAEAVAREAGSHGFVDARVRRETVGLHKIGG